MFEQIRDRLQHAWNAFNGRDHPGQYRDYGPSYSFRPDRARFNRGNERTIINAIKNRIALDVAGISMHHVRIDENGRYKEIINDGLENIMNVEANMDQTARAYVQDLVMSLFDEGYVAEVVIRADMDPNYTSGFNLEVVRTGKILEWRPNHVRVSVYNEETGLMEELIVPKSFTSIIENPFYAVMNESNSIYQRLIRKLNILDVIDEQTGSDKLNMIIQLPYVVKTEARRMEAEKRRAEIEQQLAKSKYGIAYADGTEKIIQLNRSLDNNLLSHIEYLTNMAFQLLGSTPSILDGTADEQTLLNYFDRSVEPVLAAISGERKRKFISKNARTRGETIMYFRDPFKLTPVSKLADIADKFTRNAILTSNEMRAIIGYKPVDAPIANELSNKNLKSGNETVSSNHAVSENDQNDTDTGES